MASLIQQFGRDESGAVVSAEIVMIATVGVLALVAGWNAVSASLAEELGDVANAFGSLNQSYNISGVLAPANGNGGAAFHARCSGSGFNDRDGQVIVTTSQGGVVTAAGGGSVSGAAAGGSVGGRSAAAVEALVAVDLLEVTPTVVEEDVVTEDRETAVESESAVEIDESASRLRLLAELEAELEKLEAEARKLEAEAAGDAAPQLSPQAQQRCDRIEAENARLRALIRELCRQVNAPDRD